MDTTDVLIFCEMSFKYFDYSGKYRRPSAREIGRKLGVDERTVRLRTRRMEREGFIQYYQALPNLLLFDKPLACLCNFQAHDLVSKRRALEQIREEADVIDIADFLGESFGVTIAASSQEDARKRAGEIGPRIGVSRFQLTAPRPFPVPRKRVKGLDWQIVKALRYDALKPTGMVSQELGISYRMTEYSISKLFESKVLSTRAIINARDPKGIIFYSLNLELDGRRRDRLLREFREAYKKRLWWNFNPPGSTVSLFLFATSIGMAEDDLLEALSREGVGRGSMTIFKGWIEPKRPSWIDRKVDEMIRQSALRSN